MRIINECDIDYLNKWQCQAKMPTFEMVSERINPDKSFIVISPSTSKFKRKVTGDIEIGQI